MTIYGIKTSTRLLSVQNNRFENVLIGNEI